MGSICRTVKRFFVPKGFGPQMATAISGGEYLYGIRKEEPVTVDAQDRPRVPIPFAPEILRVSKCFRSPCFSPPRSHGPSRHGEAEALRGVKRLLQSERVQAAACAARDTGVTRVSCAVAEMNPLKPQKGCAFCNLSRGLYVAASGVVCRPACSTGLICRDVTM